MKNKAIIMVLVILSFFSCSEKEKDKTNYMIQGQKVYFQIDNKRGVLQTKKLLVKEADAATFEVIPRALTYGRDKATVFRDGQKIEGADPKSFTVLDNNQYAKDKDHVYYYGMKMEGADPKTFKFIGHKYYSRDATHIFHNNHQIKGADLESFEILGDDRYAKDKNHFYDCEKQLHPSDTKTRSLIESLKKS